MTTADMHADAERILTTLAATPGLIAGIASGYDGAQLHQNPAPDAWSARDILAHLRACAVVWGRSIDRMLAEAHPTIRYVSPRTWIKRSDFLAQDFQTLLPAFTAERMVLLAALRPLDARGWRRGAAFTGTTLGKAATVLGYAQRIAEHEVGHLDQLRQTLGPRG